MHIGVLERTPGAHPTVMHGHNDLGFSVEARNRDHPHEDLARRGITRRAAIVLPKNWTGRQPEGRQLILTASCPTEALSSQMRANVPLLDAGRRTARRAFVGPDALSRTGR